MSDSLVNLRAILPPLEAIEAMGRRRYQHPKVQQTDTRDKSARRWYFRARIDALTGPGETDRMEDRFYLGNVSEMTKREAEQKRDHVLSQGINQPDLILSSQVLFGAVLDRWLKTADVRESTASGYASMVNAHLRPQWGNVRMCDITPIAVEEWLIRKAKTCSKKTLDNIRNRFSSVWKRAIFWRFTREACPLIGMQAITSVATAPRRKTLPTPDEFHHFLYLLDEPFRSIVLTCVLSGPRISEAMALTTKQLNSESTELIEAVCQSTGKIGPLKGKYSGRVIHMAHMRGDIRIPAESAPDDRPFNVGYYRIYAAVKEAAKTAGFDYEGFGCHTFRRMHNTMFRRVAGDSAAATKLAMGQLGHGDAKTNDIYFVEGAEDARKRAEVVGIVRGKLMEETIN